MSRCATTTVTARAPTRVRAPSNAIARRASARSVQTHAGQGKVLLEVKDLHAKVAELEEKAAVNAAKSRDELAQMAKANAAEAEKNAKLQKAMAAVRLFY